MKLRTWIWSLGFLAFFPYHALGQSTEKIYARTEKSVFTVEVHTGDRDAKSTLGSGYVVAEGGLVATNYHVVSSYIDEPDRFALRVKNKFGEYAAELVNFDLVNDLALLRASRIKAPPLPLADPRRLKVGKSIVSIGNPHGLRLSIIEGVFNGYAEKGLIDRMLLSMPLNSGMSGGPILNRKREVIGTNVSVIWLANNVSFGVPVAKLQPLLATPPLTGGKKAYLREMHRQLLEVETDTVTRIQEREKREKKEVVEVGRAEFDRLPSVFDCWDRSKRYKEFGVSKSSYSCNLQFTPSLGKGGEVASLEFFVEHLASEHGRFGFYGLLSNHGDAHHNVEGKNRYEAVRSAPHCTVARVRVQAIPWKINSCLNAYLEHEELYNFSLVATTLHRPQEAIYLALHGKGFRLSSFENLAQRFLKNIRFKK